MAEEKLHLNWHEIQSRLPHGNGFRFVARADVEGDSIVAVLDMVPLHNIFEDHFPDNPMVPGVILVEAIAQAAGLLVLSTHPGLRGVLRGVDSTKFTKDVRPGDVALIEVTHFIHRASVWKFKGRVTVNGKEAARAIVSLAVTGGGPIE